MHGDVLVYVLWALLAFLNPLTYRHKLQWLVTTMNAHTHVYASHFHLGAIIDTTYHLTHFTYIYLVTLGTPE